MGPEDQHPWDREDEEIRQAFAAKDAEIHRLKRDLVDAVQNIQAHSMIVDASEKDAEIERLKDKLEKAGLIIAQCGLDWIAAKQLITELYDLVQNGCEGKSNLDEYIMDLLRRARKATR